MDKIKILWADDEIELLKPHILFLNGKGYDVITALSGDEAIDLVGDDNGISAVLLDENMPGLSGLETLLKIKQSHQDFFSMSTRCQRSQESQSSKCAL